MSDLTIGAVSADNAVNRQWTRDDPTPRRNPAAAPPPGEQAAADGLTAAQPGLASGSLAQGVTALSQVDTVLQTMRSLAQDALSSPNPALRSQLESQYNAMAILVDNLVGNASVNGVDLVAASPGVLSLAAGGQGSATPTVGAIAANAAGIGVTPADWTASAAIQDSIGSLDQAIATAQSAMAGFGAPMAAVASSQSLGAATILSDQGQASTASQADLAQEATTQASLQTSRAAAAAAVDSYVKTQRTVLGLLS